MCARPRVLLVNDDEDALFLISRSIQHALPDAEVALLRNAESALAYCDKHHVDALVTDNTMPEMDGLTLVSAVRQDHASMPILLVTNSTHLADEAAKAGVTAYMPSARWNEVGPMVATLLAGR